jgi:alkylresorcinol/alkylpyrone synthase
VLDKAGLGSGEVGAIVVVSTTGIATPSLDALLVERLHLPQNVQRLPIFGLGCAGGAIGLARAATIAAAMPDKSVLFLVVELCSLTFRRDDSSKSNIVASALFGDGAVGLLLRCGGDGPFVTAAGEHTWPDSLDVMGWDVVDDGLKPIFSRDIPRLVAAELRPVARDFLGRHGLVLADIDHFVCHPGGPKVIEACEEAFVLPPGTLDAERAVLRDFGNMSAVSVLFVLERVLARASADNERWQRALMTAFGPGFTAGFVLIQNA